MRRQIKGVPTLVVAGNHKQYMHWLKANGLGPREATFVSSEKQLLGIHKARIVYCGTWWENPIANSARLKTIEVESR